MKEIFKTVFLITAIAFFSLILFYTLGWTGYSSSLKPYVNFLQRQISPNDAEVLSLQQREMELISEIENEKILEGIRKQQKLLEEQQRLLTEQENRIQVQATSLEEEKNNFLRAQELSQQQQKEKSDYQQKVNDLADTLVAMPPQKAVERILALNDDLLIIDIMKAIDQKAIAEGNISITSYYYSLMEEEDASRILKKSTVTF